MDKYFDTEYVLLVTFGNCFGLSLGIYFFKLTKIYMQFTVTKVSQKNKITITYTYKQQSGYGLGSKKV